MFRCRFGLGPILTRELRFRGVIARGDRVVALRQRSHDLLFVAQVRNPPAPGSLHTADAALECLGFGRFKVSNRQLETLAGRLKAMPRRPRLVVTVEGTQFDRRDFGRWLTAALAGLGVAPVEESTATLWAICVEERFYLCLEHGAAANPPHRRRRTAEREGSLPEPIAAAMAFLGRPTGADVVLDPTCGTGTLIAEAAALAPAARFVGIDADPAAAALARRNLAHLDGAVVLAGDGRRLDPGAGPVTLALANLPFGKQFGDSGENAALYRDILGRMASLAAPDWRGVFLTSDGEAFESAAAAAGMTVGERWPIRTRGEPATIYCLARAGGGREAVPGATDQAWDVESATQE